jgi:hypothetical protein
MIFMLDDRSSTAPCTAGHQKYFFIFAFLFLLIFSNAAIAQITRSTTFDDRPVCEEAKGVWRQFGNGCDDQCEAKFDEFIICTEESNYACDCGKGRCWNGEACVSLESYKKIYETKKAKEQKILDQAKDKRQAEAKESQQAILAKLTKKDNNAAASKPAPAAAAAPAQPQPVVTKTPATASANNDTIPPLSPQQEAALKNQAPSKTGSATVPPLFLQQEQAKQAAASSQNPAPNQAANTQPAPTPSPANSIPPGLPVVPLPN